ncbi:hypothetical protein KC326_g78 [Hortaea werneckii]|nr:hypothetical protein KC326_g78 [Hortaea werneckii]
MGWWIMRYDFLTINENSWQFPAVAGRKIKYLLLREVKAAVSSLQPYLSRIPISGVEKQKNQNTRRARLQREDPPPLTPIMAEAHLLAALRPARRAHVVELGIAVFTRQVLFVLGTSARVDLDAHAVERREAVVPRRVGSPEGEAGVGLGDFGPPGAEVVPVLRPFAEIRSLFASAATILSAAREAPGWTLRADVRVVRETRVVVRRVRSFMVGESYFDLFGVCVAVLTLKEFLLLDCSEDPTYRESGVLRWDTRACGVKRQSWP